MNKIPITRPYTGKEEAEAVSSVLSGGWLVQGRRVREFECGIAEHEGVKYGCAVTSCTAAARYWMPLWQYRRDRPHAAPSSSPGSSVS